MAHDGHGQRHAGHEDDIDYDIGRSHSERDVESKAPKREQLPPGPGGSEIATGKSQSEDGEGNSLGLRKELDTVRKVNEAIEGVIESLTKAKSNMSSVNQTVQSASTLLNTWTRILSQTEHNQRLILNPAWQGTSQDQADQERELSARQQAAERRELEEQEQRAAAAKRTEDEERRKAEAATRTSKPSQRAKGRPLGRATSTTPSATPGSVPIGGQGTRGTSRGSGRGVRRTRSSLSKGIDSGRGRGTAT